MERIGRDQEWFDEALALEANFRRDCSTLLSRRAREHEIAALRLPLTRFEVETIELDSLDAAREALLCARDDGMSIRFPPQKIGTGTEWPAPLRGVS